MSDPGTSTAYSTSPDSGRHWSDEGAWPVAPGVHRIPLPLPMDGLRAINVYVVETTDPDDDRGTGLTLIDGGWAIPEARELLDRSLRSIGSGFGDIRRFLVTHAHRDHFTMATVLGREYGVDVALGRDEEPTIDLLNQPAEERDPSVGFHPQLVAAGAPDIAEQWARSAPPNADLAQWAPPTTWLDGDTTLAVGSRSIEAVSTPGHTPGHFVFADRAADLLFAGDHVLPTITPSIGFSLPMPAQPLGDFMASLTKVRALPDLRLLPAHGPVADSTHARIDALLAHHEERLAQSLAAVRAAEAADFGAGATAYDVAGRLGWTRHQRALAELDVFNAGMATMETRAHLELLVARGEVERTEPAVADEAVRYRRRAAP